MGSLDKLESVLNNVENVAASVTNFMANSIDGKSDEEHDDIFADKTVEEVRNFAALAHMDYGQRDIEGGDNCDC